MSFEFSALQLVSYNGDQMLDQIALPFNAQHQSEQLNAINDMCSQSAITSLYLLINASQPNQALLEQLFVTLQGLYRPLMRLKNRQLWVVWQHSQEAVYRAGAQALCQIAALELARKQVSVNFIHLPQGLSDHQLQTLLQWQQGHYCTAQVLSLPTGIPTAI